MARRKKKGTHRRLIVSVQQRGGSQDHHEAIEQHVHDILAVLCGARLANTFRITVKLRVTTLGTDYGRAHWRDRSRSATARSKHHTITVKRDLPIQQQLSVVTHELKHIVQMAKGRLAFRRDAYYWRPVGHVGPSVRYDRTSCYWHRPWEVEARKAESDYRHIARRHSAAFAK